MDQNPNKPDLSQVVDQIVERTRKKLEDYQPYRERLRQALTPDGKRIRRNAKCPCGSGKKFKHCCRDHVLGELHDSCDEG